MLTDTHTHLADPLLAQHLPTVLQQAQQAGVTRFIVPATQPNDWQAVLQLNAPHIVPALGIHPWFIESDDHSQLHALDSLLAQHSHALVGEIGLDYLRATHPSERQRQQEVFSVQLRLAQQHQRPIMMHNLRASADIVRLIRHTGFQQGGFAHAFSGSLEEAHGFIRYGFKIGIGVLLLNPHAKKVRRAATELPLEHLVLETDSPFMLPDGSNQPAKIRLIAEHICQLRGISLAQLAKQTEANIHAVLKCRPTYYPDLE